MDYKAQSCAFCGSGALKLISHKLTDGNVFYTYRCEACGETFSTETAYLARKAREEKRAAIDSALGFVADITPICKSENKGVPNPNVMCELGYALSSLSDERVILVYNSANCNYDDIPFDLRQKRCISYECDATTSAKDKKEAKKRLKNTFEEAIIAIAEL